MHCLQDDLPKDCRIVAFPRSPKPHEIVGKWTWVDKYWIYEGNGEGKKQEVIVEEANEEQEEVKEPD